MFRYNWPDTMGPPGLFGLGQGHSPLLQTEVSDSVVMAAVATTHPPCGEERAGSSSGSKRDIRLGSRGLRSFTLPRGGCRWLMESQKLAPCPGTQPEEWWATGLGHPAKGIYPPTRADGGGYHPGYRGGGGERTKGDISCHPTHKGGIGQGREVGRRNSKTNNTKYRGWDLRHS